MSYNDKEHSVAESKPIELYDLADNFGNHWRYTSSAEDVIFLGNNFEARPCQRKDFEMSDNMFKNTIEVSLGRNNLFANQYIAGTPESEISLTIYRLQGSDYVYYWSGVVASVSFDANGIPTIRANPKTSESIRVGKRRKCQVLCDHALYDSGCRVNRELYKVTGAISGISGMSITSATFATKPAGWFTGGIFIVGDAKRFIKSHSGSTVVLSRPMLNITAGNSFTAYRGCPHTPAACLDEFANKLNYGGEEFLPTKNPYKTAVTINGTNAQTNTWEGITIA